MADRCYAVVADGTRIGLVALVLAERPTGTTLRRIWWALPPERDPRPLPRPFETRANAVAALHYRHATLNKPKPPEPVDATLLTIRSAFRLAGPSAAVWLGASLAVHHLVEMEANRHTNPPPIWHELRRVVAWLQAATGNEPDALSAGSVHYRRTSEIAQDGPAGSCGT